MDASFYAPAGTVSVSGGSVPIPASPNRLPSWVSQSAKDLPSFQVVPPSHRLNSEDLKLPDGTPMIGPDGFLVPPSRNFSMVVNAATRIFSYRFDEAMRDNFISARAMRRDAFIRGLLEERILPTINRKWQLEVDDDSHPDQKLVRDSLTKLIQNLPDFDAMKRALLDAVWFGRAGVQWNHYRNPEMENLWTIQKWDPVHGDSIQFTFDGTPAILMDATTTGWYASHGATYGPGGDLRPTDRGGTALVLQRPLWRDRFALHVHMREKADFFEGELAGSVQGLGLRGLIYWHYVIRTEALTWMLTYMQSVGQMDLLVFNYPQGDDAAKLNAEANARKIIGKAAIACPRDPKGNWPPVEQIPMNSEGLKALHELISEYFDRHIERLIVGQSMSAGADKENGLGGTGRADFAKATKDEILLYDAGRFDSTFTKDVIGPLKRFNYAWAKFPVRFKSILPDLEAKDKVSNGTTLIQAGVKIKTDEFREAAGFSRPEEGDETVGGDQTMGMGGVPGANPNSPMHVAGPGGQGSQPFGQGPSNPAQKPPEPPAAAATYPRHTPALPAAAGGSMLPFPGERNANGHPPVRNDGGGGPGGGMGGPAAGGVGTSPAMGFPGGGNTYLPKFGDKDEWRNRVGFTRFDSFLQPTQYTPDASGHEHKPAGPGGGQFTSGHHAAAREVVEKGKRSGKEHSIAIDREGRKIADREGEHGAVEIPNHEQVFREGSGLTVVHNHPDSSNLSPQDFKMLYSYPGVDRITAVTHDGKIQSAMLRADRKQVAKAADDYQTAVKDSILKKAISVPEMTDQARDGLRKERDELLGHVSEHLAQLGLIEFTEEKLPYLGPPGRIQHLPGGALPPNPMVTTNPGGAWSRGQNPTQYDHKYGCLMAPLDGEALMCVLRAGSNILDQDLADEGREDKPHVTVRFGFEQGVSAEDIGWLLANHGPVKLHLGKVGCFENDEHDVLFLEVHSPDLLHLHRKTSVLPHKSSDHDYKPHATIGYVKKGLGKLYAEMIPAADYEATVDELEFKTADAPSLSPEPSME